MCDFVISHYCPNITPIFVEPLIEADYSEDTEKYPPVVRRGGQITFSYYFTTNRLSRWDNAPIYENKYFVIWGNDLVVSGWLLIICVIL